jgi:serine/threonine protein phosphatase PrpC
MVCPACTVEAPEEDAFCESCGQRLGGAPAPAGPASGPPVAGCVCGAPRGDVDEDGFCLQCGRRVVRPPSDHIEEPISPVFAAVSDRGLRHDRNEDRFAIVEAGGGYAMVVCDGVSATRKSEIASSAVSAGVLESLAEALRAGKIEDSEAAMRAAIAAGVAKLAAQSQREESGNAPSTTVVAALVADGMATIGWVGDSRAYWVDAEQAWPLTQDHSWMNEIVAAHEMSLEQAAASPKAHAITRWIGADAGPESTPDVVHRKLSEPGILLLCTDGLWNYAQDSPALAKLVHEAGDDALTIAKKLVEFANGCGGQDNVTVAVLKTA